MNTAKGSNITDKLQGNEMKDIHEKNTKALNIKNRSSDEKVLKNTGAQMKDSVVSERPRSMLELIRSKMGGASSK